VHQKSVMGVHELLAICAEEIAQLSRERWVVEMSALEKAGEKL
jgi:hypothetical protein